MLLKRQEEETNVYAAMTTAVLFAERNRNDNAEQILSRCQEANRNDPAVLYNKALIEYIKGKHPASLTILSSYNDKQSSQSQNNSVIILLAINNFLLKNFEDAYRGFALLVQQNPDDQKHLYNFAAYLHQYAQYTFRLQGRDVSQTQRALQYLEKAKKIFAQVSKQIGKRFPNYLSFPQSFSDAKKKRLFNEIHKLRTMAEKNLFFINENKELYAGMVKGDEEKQVKKKVTKGERSQRVLTFQSKKKQKDEEEVLRKQREMEELERRAKEEMEKAETMREALIIAKNTTAGRKRSRKQKMERGDIIQDEKGNMPLLDFQGDNGDDEKEFEDIYDIQKGGAMKLPVKQPKVQTTKKKLRKLKKNREVVQEKLDESDEMLDLDLNGDDSDNNSEINLNGSDNEDDKMALETPTPMFKADDEDDEGEAQF